MKTDLYVPLAIIAFLLLASSFLEYKHWQFFSLVILSISYGFLLSETFWLGKLNVEMGIYLCFLFLGIIYQSWKFYSNYIHKTT
jgi:hypothetical protein